LARLGFYCRTAIVVVLLILDAKPRDYLPDGHRFTLTPYHNMKNELKRQIAQVVAIVQFAICILQLPICKKNKLANCDPT
jgi:hypothetical protein